MQESILKFLESEKSLLWVKTYDYTEVENGISTGLEKLENKKFFVYEAGKTVNKFTEETLATEDLFNTLDELYPQGIRKVPIFLLIKDSLEEILKKNNLDYIKEILDTKKANPKYNFTLIIADVEEVPVQLENMVKFLDKQVIDNEKNITKYISDLAKFAKVEIDENSIKKIVKDLKESIFKYRGVSSNEKSEMLEVENEIKPKLEDSIIVKGGKYKPSFADEIKEVFNLEVGKYPVTQALYKEITGTNPAYFVEKSIIGGGYYKKDEKRPLECQTWWQALEFCNKLSKKYNLKPVYDLTKSSEGILMINQLKGGRTYSDVANFEDTEGFRLPTEVEWEWFALGGEKGNRSNKYAGSNNINEVAWYSGNSGNQTHRVGLKKPNELGLYDCSGNVTEWCYDTYEGINKVAKGKMYNYTAFDNTHKQRVVRGGSWGFDIKSSEILYRIGYDATYKGHYDNWDGKSYYNNHAGFRVVRTVNSEK